MKRDAAALMHDSTNQDESMIESLTEEDRARLAAEWKSVPLILMLPACRLAETEEILQVHPELWRVLESCKRGLLNCWDAMQALGMLDPYGMAEIMR